MKSNFELFFKTIDESVSYITEYSDKNYLELLIISLENLAFNEVNAMFDEEQVSYLTSLYEKLEDKDFSVEDIRKSLEFLILKAFKEVGYKNIQTPNVLCLFISYLIDRLNNNRKKTLNILDPLIGTGNLIFAISNNLEVDTNLFGIDISEDMIKVAQVSALTLNKEIELFFQDTLSVGVNDMDFIVLDTLNYDIQDELFFPYELINHHKQNLVDDGYMICITLNDFFENNIDIKKKEEVFEGLNVVGVFELPDNLFLGQNKIIVIFKKTLKKLEKSLVVKLPSFNDINVFNDTLVNIENWLKNNI